MTFILMLALGIALALVLSMRRIDIKQLEFWLIYVVAGCCFLVGRVGA